MVTGGVEELNREMVRVASTTLCVVNFCERYNDDDPVTTCGLRIKERNSEIEEDGWRKCISSRDLMINVMVRNRLAHLYSDARTEYVAQHDSNVW